MTAPRIGGEALHAIDIVRGPIAEHLAERGSEILRVGGGAGADEDAVGVIGVARVIIL
jgi:hypothetical protein